MAFGVGVTTVSMSVTVDFTEDGCFIRSDNWTKGWTRGSIRGLPRCREFHCGLIVDFASLVVSESGDRYIGGGQ